MPKAYPPEFRRDVVAVARKGDATLTQIAEDFGISQSCLHHWLQIADVDDGVRPGVTSSEAAERKLKKRNRTWSKRTRSCVAPRRTSRARTSQNEIPAGP